MARAIFNLLFILFSISMSNEMQGNKALNEGAQYIQLANSKHFDSRGSMMHACPLCKPIKECRDHLLLFDREIHLAYFSGDIEFLKESVTCMQTQSNRLQVESPKLAKRFERLLIRANHFIERIEHRRELSPTMTRIENRFFKKFNLKAASLKKQVDMAHQAHDFAQLKELAAQAREMAKSIALRPYSHFPSVQALSIRFNQVADRAEKLKKGF